MKKEKESNLEIIRELRMKFIEKTGKTPNVIYNPKITKNDADHASIPLECFGLIPKKFIQIYGMNAKKSKSKPKNFVAYEEA